MTPRDAIKRAMRLIGALETGGTPTADELTDTLSAFNGMVLALFGTAIGQRLAPKTYSAASTLEAGRQAMCSLSAAVTLTLPANPSDGDRVALVDVGGNFATYNLTLARNSRLLEGAASNLTLSTNLMSRSWFFREDTGNWEREAALTIDQAIFFPEEICEHLVWMLASSLAPEFSGTAPPDHIAARAAAGIQAIAGRYGRPQ
jgi:hypothetical protein